jgi:hypothetical protein
VANRSVDGRQHLADGIEVVEGFAKAKVFELLLRVSSRGKVANFSFLVAGYAWFNRPKRSFANVI